jgi:hypothetical protein
VSLSPLELAERSACNLALRETIGRQLKAEYDTTYALPDHLLGLLQQLQRDEETPLGLAAAPMKGSALVGLIADVRKKRSYMESLLSRLINNTAKLERAIEAARETVERSQRCRDRCQSFSGAGLEGCGP